MSPLEGLPKGWETVAEKAQESGPWLPFRRALSGSSGGDLSPKGPVLTGGPDGVAGRAARAAAVGVHGSHGKLVVGVRIEAPDNHGVHLDPLLDEGPTVVEIWP